MKKLSIFFFGFILFFLTHACAKQIEVYEVDIVDFGIYETVSTGRTIKTERVAAGVIEPTTSEKLIQQTEIIEARIGLSYGFRFIIKGHPKGEKIALSCDAIHPAMTNPQTGKTFTEETFDHYFIIGKINRHSFKIEEEWELVPGEWLYRQKD